MIDKFKRSFNFVCFQPETEKYCTIFVRFLYALERHKIDFVKWILWMISFVYQELNFCMFLKKTH